MTYIPVLMDPLFCRLFRIDGIYVNMDGTKYSIKKIETVEINKKTGEEMTDRYFTYSDGIKFKFPGYELDSNNIVVNSGNKTVDLE